MQSKQIRNSEFEIQSCVLVTILRFRSSFGLILSECWFYSQYNIVHYCRYSGSVVNIQNPKKLSQLPIIHLAFDSKIDDMKKWRIIIIFLIRHSSDKGWFEEAQKSAVQLVHEHASIA